MPSRPCIGLGPMGAGLCGPFGQEMGDSLTCSHDIGDSLIVLTWEAC